MSMEQQKQLRKGEEGWVRYGLGGKVQGASSKVRYGVWSVTYS